MSRQLNWYHNHAEEINRKKREKRKAVKPSSVKPSSPSERKAIQRKAVLSSSHIPLSEPTLRIRLHRFYYKVSILNAVSEERLRGLRLNEGLNNIRQWLGVGFRITQGSKARSLELEGIEIISDYRLDIALIQAQARTLAQNIVESLSLQYGLNLSKEGHTPPKLTEMELSATQMTDRLKEFEKKGILPLYEDKEGYRIWADWSFGIGGMESNNPTYLQRISDFSKDLAEKDGWQEMKATLKKVIDSQLYFAKNMEAHVRIVREATRLIKEVRKEREDKPEPTLLCQHCLKPFTKGKEQEHFDCAKTSL